MAEHSLPWGGTTLGDAAAGALGAPYTDDRWSDTWAALFTHDRTVQGVVYTTHPSYNGNLEVSWAAGNTVEVATGIGMVDGKVYWNTAELSLAIAVPGGGSNFYTVVLRKTWAAQTVRAAILGPNVALPPVVTQNDGVVWEISLATVEVPSAGNPVVTDVREYVGQQYPGTKSVFVPATIGWNDTDSTLINLSTDDGFVAPMRVGIELPDAKDAEAIGNWSIPLDFDPSRFSELVLQCAAVIDGAAAGNVYGGNVYAYGLSPGGATGSEGLSGITDAAALYMWLGEDSPAAAPVVIPGVTIFQLAYRRLAATNPGADTCATSIWALGWIVTYPALAE